MSLSTISTRGKRSQERAKLAAIQAEVRAVVATGCCPDCGRGLRQNLAILGWWQCEQYGAVGFRKDATQPSCGWQGFTQ